MRMITCTRLVGSTVVAVMVALSPATFGHASQKPDAAKEGRVVIKKSDPDQGAVVTGYTDLRWGCSVVVKGGTPQQVALQWLDIVVKARVADHESESKDGRYESELSTLVGTNHGNGLLAVTGVFGGTSVVVSWGDFKLEGTGGGIVTTSARDLRTGRVIVARSGASEFSEEWRAKVNAAGSAADLEALINGNHSRGLIGAEIGLEGRRISSSWRPMDIAK